MFLFVCVIDMFLFGSIQIPHHQGHGGPLHSSDGELTGRKYPLRLEEHLLRLPPGSLRSGREHRGAGLPNHRTYRQ